MSHKIQLLFFGILLWGVGCSPKHIEKISPLEPPQEKLSATYEAIRSTIFQNKCFQCHSVGGVASRVPLQPLEDLLSSPLDLVIPENPEESGLYLVVLENARKKMPPLNSGIAPLTADEIGAIFDWIKNGATD